MSEKDRYVELRKQLAELAHRFFRASTQFPSSYYEFVDADSRLSIADWNQWILDNRTPADLLRQKWDIFPAGYVQDYDKVFSREFEIESDRTRNCGVLLSPPATLEAAQIELETLADTGMRILLAIRDEVKRRPSLDKSAILPTLPDGHRGWLDLVRNTAEINRGVSLKVEYSIFNISRDLRSQITESKKRFAERCNATTHVSSPIDSCVCRVTPDIFSASTNAISIWLQGKQAEPIAPLVSPGLTIPVLPSPDDRDEALQLLYSLNPQHAQSPPIPAVQKPKLKRGRKPVDAQTRALDRRIYTLIKSGRTRKDLARELNLSAADIRKAYDRERQQRKRSGSK